MTRKRLILAVLLLIITGLAIYFVYQKGQQKNNSNDRSEQITVVLEGVNSDAILDPSDTEIMKNAVQRIVRFNVMGNPKTYKANVREGSVKHSTTQSGLPQVRYLIDIPELERTFVVEKEGNAQSDFSSLYVLCPQTADLIYKVQECKDLE